MHRLALEREYFDLFLWAEKWEGEISNKEPHKCDELAWYSLDELPDNIIPEVRLALNNVRSDVHYSEIGWK